MFSADEEVPVKKTKVKITKLGANCYKFGKNDVPHAISVASTINSN